MRKIIIKRKVIDNKIMNQSIKSKDKLVNMLFHYDSDVVNQEDKTMIIKVPHDGEYYWSAHNISLKYPDTYVPDQLSGYLYVTEFSEDQVGIVSLAGIAKRIKGLLFPLREPANQFPKCKVYNKVFLHRGDQFIVQFVDKNLDVIIMDRIVVAFHCVNDLELLYIN